MRWEELSEQPCSLARVLAILGDRWTLLVLRDCFLGVRRFDDFERSLGVTRHVLADRLKRLVEAEILAKVPYQERPLREEYRLTEKGMELYPAILSLVNWGDRHLAGVEGPPLEHPVAVEHVVQALEIGQGGVGRGGDVAATVVEIGLAQVEMLAGGGNELPEAGGVAARQGEGVVGASRPTACTRSG